MPSPEQLPLPHVFEPPDPQPKPDKRKAIAVAKKPVVREVSVDHPAVVQRLA